MKPRSRSVLALQSLESRETPAVTIVNPHTATFTDIDGDLATVKVWAGTLTAGLFTTAPKGLGDQLEEINLSGGGFDHATLTITAKRGPTGDGLVNVGYINSTGHDLGSVTVAGDLGQIDAGDAVTTTPAVKSLAVRSMGRYGLDTQILGGSLESDFNGALAKLAVKGDVAGAVVNVIGGVNGTIGSVTIGGSLVGGAGPDKGWILAGGDIGPVRVGHDIVGGAVEPSGEISTLGKLAGVTIGGSLIGGASRQSGIIFAADIGPVRVGHDIVAGAVAATGVIISFGNLAGVTVGGSLIGGVGTNSGSILSTGDLGPVKIGQDVVGGSISGTAGDVDSSGSVLSHGGRIASVYIGGSIISGVDTSTAGSLTNDATIRAGNDLGSVTVRGSLVGNSNPNGDSPVIISARGQAVPGATTDVAIGKISIGGQVTDARILAGYDINLNPANADAQVGAVTVGGDWIASSLVAGVAIGADHLYGTADDAVIIGGSPGIVSKIASVVIRGLVYGTPGTGDHFGFVAQQIGSFKAGGVAAHLTAAKDVVELAPTTGDVTVREVA
jgi:hypothetical protein